MLLEGYRSQSVTQDISPEFIEYQGELLAHNIFECARVGEGACGLGQTQSAGQPVLIQTESVLNADTSPTEP